jgi:oligopeptide/dipeptide ABC transporter ATP-binding protein
VIADDPLLEVSDLRTWFRSGGEIARAVDGVSFAVRRGETLAIVGESGSGKSVTALSLMRLIPSPPGEIAGGSAMFRDRAGVRHDLLRLSERAMRRVRGDEIAMIFQEPMSSLNPLITVGEQIGEVIRLHRGAGRAAAERQAIELLARVHVPDAARRAADYPHRLSGGMRQRVMIAISLAAEPKLLLADEPTTALDVTIQDQILKLLLRLKDELSMSVILVTHDLGVVAETCDRVAVLYAGRMMEVGTARAIFANPAHAYTLGLLRSVPDPRHPRQPLASISGQPPDPAAIPPGCRFARRCVYAVAQCGEALPALRDVGGGHESACIRTDAIQALAMEAA